jgi:uncharacterized damage-inducible protein DinB
MSATSSQGTTQSVAVTKPGAVAADRVEVARLADQLERSFRGGAWHGPSVAESLDGVDATLAARRLVAGAHSIGELAAHIGFWIDEAVRRIEGTPSATVPEAINFPPDAAATPAAWAATLAALETAHRRLHGIVVGLTDAQLEGAVAGSDPTVRGLLLGIAQHNAYHAGQVVVLRKLAGSAP